MSVHVHCIVEPSPCGGVYLACSTRDPIPYIVHRRLMDQNMSTTLTDHVIRVINNGIQDSDDEYMMEQYSKIEISLE